MCEHPIQSINFNNPKEVCELYVYSMINLYTITKNKSDIKEAARLVNEVKGDVKQLELWKYINKKSANSKIAVAKTDLV